VAERVFAAVDLGASSGRVVAGVVDDDDVALDVVHRFPNAARPADGRLRWDLARLYDETLVGLAALAARHPRVESIGIDGWGVDYALLDGKGFLLGDPVSHRDGGFGKGVGCIHEHIGREHLYRMTGVQFLPFSTIYQLAAEPRDERWSHVAHIVLLPDLFAYLLTGELRAEYTNATTTGLVDVTTRAWSSSLLDVLGLADGVLPPIAVPGTDCGRLRDDVAARLVLPTTTRVTTVASHDTASAVAAVPATCRDFGYVSCGTWSLVGVEVDAPILSDDARLANFTNEGGVDGTTRFLRNVGGLWLLQECLRHWADRGTPRDLDGLLAEASQLPPGPRFDADDPALVAPGDMPARIATALRERGEPVPVSPAAMVRCILDSLADAYAATLRRASSLSGAGIDVVHVVGGGSQNSELCRLVADAVCRPVVAGPVEATALGNVLVQARASGALPDDLAELRTRIAERAPLTRYEPR
jgi:rhamnulokinase